MIPEQLPMRLISQEILVSTFVEYFLSLRIHVAGL
jgi:hypothetical protein